MKLFRIRLRLVATSYGDVEVLAKDEDAAREMARLFGDMIELSDTSPPDYENHIYEFEEIEEPTNGCPVLGSLTGKIERLPRSSRNSYTMTPELVRAYLAGYRARDK